MNRRSFISSLAPLLYLPRAMDSYIWKPARGISAEDIHKAIAMLEADINPAWLDAPYESYFLCNEVYHELLIGPPPKAPC